MCVHSSATEIHTPTHRNLNGRSMTVPSPVLTPNSILPPTSSYCPLIPTSKKILFACQKSFYIDSFLFFFNYLNMKVHKLENVCVEINPCIRRNTSVIIVASLRTGRPWNQRSIPGMIRGFSVLHSIQTGSGSSSILMLLFPWEVKRPGREAEHSTPSFSLTTLMSCN